MPERMSVEAKARAIGEEAFLEQTFRHHFCALSEPIGSDCSGKL